MRIIYVPIEPLEERYTASWYKNFPKAFEELGAEVVVIDGEALSDTIEVGTFLDINSTVHYKMSQLQKIAKMFSEGFFKDNDHFFFGDVEFWGLESVRLMAQMNKVGIKMHGYLHAASFTKGDAFAIAEDYQKFTEVGWAACLNTVFVPTNYQRSAFNSRRLNRIAKDHLLESRLCVVGNPLFLSDYDMSKVEKKKQIVLPNRFDVEKNPLQSLRAALQVARRHGCSVVITTGRKKFRGSCKETIRKAYNLIEEASREGLDVDVKTGLTKAEYHKILAESMFMYSHSEEESFGYCIVEAMLYRCIPVVYDGASHKELVPETVESVPLRFTTGDDSVIAMNVLMGLPSEVIQRIADTLYFKALGSYGNNAVPIKILQAMYVS